MKSAISTARRLIGCALLALGACGTGPPAATAADAERANIALIDLERGRTLVLTRCGSCHRSPLPTDFPAAQWPERVADMAERARVDRQQQKLIEQYLITMSNR